MRFLDKLEELNIDLRPKELATLQVNITKLCNQACVHCHVDSSPRRREMMSDEALAACLARLEEIPTLDTLDITGGAPELHAGFRDFVVEARRLGTRVIVRHNLTVTMDPHPMTKESMAYLPEFFAEQGVEVVSSLPCYSEDNTDKQRGDGVFEKSIESLKRLNAQGIGRPGSGLVLTLVYNPVGAFLPGDQRKLEADYKKELRSEYGIEFTNLIAITNMPIHRFKVQLRREKAYEEYMELLSNAFNPDAAEEVMCRTMISVAHDGTIYDCDFNQMLGMKISGSTIFDLDVNSLQQRQILLGDHCFGCTAGAGSSCGGTTA